MSDDCFIPSAFVEAWSRGDMTHREVATAMGRYVHFADPLEAVIDLGLPIPQKTTGPDSPAVRLLAEHLERTAPRTWHGTSVPGFVAGRRERRSTWNLTMGCAEGQP